MRLSIFLTICFLSMPRTTRGTYFLCIDRLLHVLSVNWDATFPIHYLIISPIFRPPCMTFACNHRDNFCTRLFKPTCKCIYPLKWQIIEGFSKFAVPSWWIFASFLELTPPRLVVKNWIQFAEMTLSAARLSQAEQTRCWRSFPQSVMKCYLLISEHGSYMFTCIYSEYIYCLYYAKCNLLKVHKKSMKLLSIFT